MGLGEGGSPESLTAEGPPGKRGRGRRRRRRRRRRLHFISSSSFLFSFAAGRGGCGERGHGSLSLFNRQVKDCLTFFFLLFLLGPLSLPEVHFSEVCSRVNAKYFFLSQKKSCRFFPVSFRGVFSTPLKIALQGVPPKEPTAAGQ